MNLVSFLGLRKRNLVRESLSVYPEASVHPDTVRRVDLVENKGRSERSSSSRSRRLDNSAGFLLIHVLSSMHNIEVDGILTIKHYYIDFSNPIEGFNGSQ